VAEIHFSRIVADLPLTVPFVAPEALERRRGRPFRARIGANESPFGPSPAALHAMEQAAAEVWKYGDPENRALIDALSRRIGVADGCVVVGEGIDALLGYAVRMLVDPGAAVVSSTGGYPTFAFHVAGYGGRLVTVPFQDDREDLEALLAAAEREQARAVYLCNPDNPMGTWWSGAEVALFARSLPPSTVLLLDEAYAEFAPPEALAAPDALMDRVLRFRTFSKAHGMAGARIGYAFGDPALVGRFDAFRNHFGVNRIAQAGALASLGDANHLLDVVHHVERAKGRLSAIAAANGLGALPSATNFVTMDCGADGAFARRVLMALEDLDVCVRMPGVPPLDRCIRVSAGTDSELDAFEETLPVALAQARDVVLGARASQASPGE
jgi:histidinol-phosphate aminotransferase